MRRLAPISLLAVPAALLLAGCGSKGVVGPTPVKVVGTLPKATIEPATPALKLKGNAVAGKKIFETSGCGSCHTLSDAGATGTVGPNLDQAQPDYRLATARITLGKGGMPAFKGQLTDQQIADVAAYVVKATTGENPGTTEP
jgi:mono/diheme cytochrome c family protein